MRRARSTAARAALIGVLACGAACGPNTLADRGDRYVEAVAQALRVDPPTLDDAARPAALPRRRSRILAAADHRIGILDFLALQGCELGVLAGRNMSAMGRQMPYSMRLTHELALLEASDGCLAQLEDEERRAEIASIVAAKRGERGLHVWNAVWAGDEMEAYLSRSRLAALESSTGAGASRALGRLVDRVVAVREREADGQAVERALARLLQVRPVGGALRDLEVGTRRLDAVSDLVGRVDAAECGPTQARLTRAFQGTYLLFFQQPLGFAHRRAADELPRLHALAEVSASSLRASGIEAPPPMQAWFHAALDLGRTDAVWPSYLRAVHRHVAAWAPILTVCGALAAPDEVVAEQLAPRETERSRASFVLSRNFLDIRTSDLDRSPHH